jgi:hypothetical protein
MLRPEPLEAGLSHMKFLYSGWRDIPHPAPPRNGKGDANAAVSAEIGELGAL